MQQELTTITTLDQAQKIFDMLDVSSSTREDYKKRIGYFIKFVEERGFNINTFLEFKRHLAKQNHYGISTKNKYLIVSRIFIREIVRRGILPNDITNNIRTFPQSRKHKKFGLSQDEVDRLTEWLRNLPPTPRTWRTRAVFALLILNGLRSIEIQRADRTDLQISKKLLYVRRKGMEHEREPVHLHPTTARVLREYVKSNKIADGALFVSGSNNSQNKRITTKGLRDITGIAYSSAGIDKTGNHCARHFFCTHMIKKFDGKLTEIIKYSGHSDLSMLQVYNDNVEMTESLPKFYRAFDNILTA